MWERLFPKCWRRCLRKIASPPWIISCELTVLSNCFFYLINSVKAICLSLLVLGQVNEKNEISSSQMTEVANRCHLTMKWNDQQTSFSKSQHYMWADTAPYWIHVVKFIQSLTMSNLSSQTVVNVRKSCLDKYGPQWQNLLSIQLR